MCHNHLRWSGQILIAGILLSLFFGIRPVEASEPIVPLLPTPALDPRKVELGDRLFHDPRLSHDDTIACSSCHILAIGGVDRLPRSPGIEGQMGAVNTPTVYNSGLNFVQFWDGRAPTLEAQAAGPIHNPVEMGSNWEEVLAKLKRDPGYTQAFDAIYPEGIGAAAIQDAIATFERSLITSDSPFDNWLKGDQFAITPQQKRGYMLFKSYGCIACHQGANMGGNLYQRMGMFGDYFGEREREEKAADQGRFNVTGAEDDRHLFKVPSLRLATLTPPYFHDGTAKTLEEAVRTMALYQLGRNISKRDTADIVAFLHSVAGTHPKLQR